MDVITIDSDGENDCLMEVNQDPQSKHINLLHFLWNTLELHI